LASSKETIPLGAVLVLSGASMVRMANNRMALIKRLAKITRFRAELERLSNGDTQRILSSNSSLKSVWWHIFANY
jgi:hypothetical protein